MKKLFSVTLILIMLIPTMTSCHKPRKAAEFKVPADFDLSENFEITFWAKNDTNKTQSDIYKKAIEDFHKLYPNITVNLRLYTDYNRIYDDVITNISTGTTPNVCVTYPDHIATYMTGSNIVVPLDSLMSDKEYGFGGSRLGYDSPTEEEMIPQYLDECRINGVVYALPFMRSTEACYVNKTYVEALGFELPETLTWDFIWEVAEKATEKNEDGTFKVNGQNVMIPFIYKSTDNMMIQYLEQNGSGYSDETGNILLFNDETEKFLAEISTHAATGAFSTFKVSSYPANFLNAGQCIFAIDSTAGSTWMGSKAPLVDIPKESLIDFEIEVMKIPQIDPENPKMISQGPSLCVFNKDDPDEVLASWIFMQYLLTNEVQISYSQTEGYVPVTSKAQQSAEYLDYISRSGEDNSFYYSVKIDAVKMLNENVEYTFTTPVWNGSASLRNAAGELVESVTKSSRRKEDMSGDYYTGLYKSTVSLYHLDQTSGKVPLGKLPTMSVALFASFGAVWLFIITYFAVTFVKKKRKSGD